MTVSSLQEAARQEAERRYRGNAWTGPFPQEDTTPNALTLLQRRSFKEGFEAGAAWAEQEAAARERDLEQALTNICEYATRHEDTNEVAHIILLMADMALVRNPGPVVVGVPPELGSTGQED